MAKAFKSVSLPKLIYKLNKIGLHNNIVCWIQNYLSNRKFYVRVNNVISSTFDAIFGVPQSSSLGPLLHVIYTDDLVKMIKKCEIFQYADDCKFEKIILSAVDCIFLQADLDALIQWYNKWQLIVNIVKSSCMHLCSSVAFTYHINNNILVKVNSFKDHGITYSDSCCFNAHIINIVKQAKYLSHLLFCTFVIILLGSVYTCLLLMFVHYWK